VPTVPQSPLDRSIAAAARQEFIALLVLFAASGCAALIYQIVWLQLLSLAIGASALSLGVLLATFLGGMCLGSLALARIVSPLHNPLRIYAVIEIGIAVLGVVTLHAIPAIGAAYSAWSGTGTASIVLRLLVAALCMLAPTVLIGATLPAIARSPAALRGAGTLGFLYAANTGGAVFGCVLAGFYLLPVHDAHVATFVAVALNIGVAAVAFGLAARAGPLLAASAPRAATAEAGAHCPVTLTPTALPVSSGGRAAWAIYLATALSGMTALSAEVLWTRHLSLLFGGTVYTFALILAVFLIGLAIGAAAGAALGRRGSPRRALAACQLLLCVAISWAAYTIARSLPFWPIDVTFPAIAAVALQLDLLRTGWAILPAAILWGASFPLALAAAVEAEPAGDRRRIVGRLYAANTLGAIAGSLVTTFVLVVWLGSQRAQQLAIVTAALAAVLLLARSEEAAPRFAARRRTVRAAAALSAALALAYAVPPLPPALVAYGRFLRSRGMGANVIYVGEGLTASIAVTREPSGVLTYHNAGKTQASTYSQDLRLQRMLGHLATLVPDDPRSVLVIGLGAGITAGAVSVDPVVERVVVAEIEPLVPRAAATYFAAHNFGVVDSPKIEIRVDDGRHYLATTRERFDAITSDPLDPWVKGAAALYTREFWALCKERLNPGGVVTVFLQLYESSDESAASEIATFLEAFPNGALFANTVEGHGYDAVLLGRADDSPIDVDRIQRRLESGAYARVARSLRDVGLDSALDLIGTYAGQAEDFATWLDGAAINTDRNLRLQYLAGESLNAQRADAILAGLTAHEPRFPDGLVTGSPARLEELRQRIAAGRRGY